MRFLTASERLLELLGLVGTVRDEGKGLMEVGWFDGGTERPAPRDNKGVTPWMDVGGIATLERGRGVMPME